MLKQLFHSLDSVRIIRITLQMISKYVANNNYNCDIPSNSIIVTVIVPVFAPCCYYPPGEGEEIPRTRLTVAYNLFRGGK